MEVSILFPFRLPLCIKLHENYEVCKWCFALEFPSYFWCLGVVLIFCVGKALNVRPGNCVCFLTREQGSRTEEDVSIVLWWCFVFFFFPCARNIMLCCQKNDHLCSWKSCSLLAHAAFLGININILIFSPLLYTRKSMKCMFLTVLF